jgi:signal transduction histidine kinase/CheY-like chemotaxis protein
MMEHYSIVILVTVTVIAMLWAFVQHASRQRQGAARRLSMVRDFADVGLLSFNLDRLRFRADTSTQRLLGTQAAGSAAEFTALFQSGDGADLGRALRTGQHGSVDLVLTRQEIDTEQQVLRMCLWYETAPSGDQVAYGLVLDVTSDHRQERALKETLAELSSRQERQRQLFSIISHELRTPASVVSMLVEDLDDHQIASPVRKQLRDATDQLLSTLADMRQTVNPTQNLPINRIAYAAAELAESIRNMFAAQAKDHGMTIRLRLCDASRVLRIGDQMRVRQAISNVVRNAIIHSRGSEVVIGFEEINSGEALISRWTITDNGIGIPSTEVARLFKPFERGIQDPRSHADGSGLGLFIAKSSVEMLDGLIVHFDPAHGGTGYQIDLPEPKASDTPAPPNPTAFETARFPNFYVLLAEDNALVAEVTLAKLSRFVGRVELVGNGREALDKIAEHCPDLLITDLFMPEMDGDDLIRRLRARHSDLSIIGLTAAVVGDDIERLTEAGADQVMAKPMDMRGLRKFIYDLTEARQKKLGVA